MRIRSVTAVLALLAVMATVIVVDVANSQNAEAQPGPIVGRAALAVATDVVNGSVIATQSVDTGTAVFSLAIVEVTSAVTGDLSGQIFVEVPGGKNAAGLDVIVSHQPSFRVGDQVQLALVRATPEEEQQLRGGEPVYSVVGGLDGAAATSGTVLSQAQLNGETFTLLGVKWDSFPVTYRINPNNGFLAASQVTSILQAAFQEWEDDPFSDIDFVFGGTTTAASDNYNDNQNTLAWVTPTSAADNWLAQAVWVPSNGSILSFDIQFNSSYVFSAGALPGQFDLGTVALHEIGHILGLGHIDRPGTENEVMFPSITSNSVKTLGPGDREGAADLYPAASPPVVYPPTGPFTDVPPTAFFADPVLWAYQQGIASGTSASTFSPNRPATRADMALLMHRFVGTPGGAPPSGFFDVAASNQQLTAAVDWMLASGVTTGTSTTTFSPAVALNRAQAATFLWRYQGSPAAPNQPFLDVAVPSYYADAVAWMASANITTGISATAYGPQRPVTRGQVVTFLYRLAGAPPVQ